ncbi:hypothetical protein [Paenibacillus sp. NRS-1760]|uniref:hypothetical protein n=1 Tax=Paenibacillus sp. NRS-1760 TaxID=3233902 RepID=UPI003D28D756
MPNLLPMYPGVANSYQTELSAAINASVTTIPLQSVAVSILPDAPNIAVIGVDETAETILYTGKTGNSLTGVTRGYNGTTARSWPTGAKVARMFTAADWDAARQNIDTLNAMQSEAASIPETIKRGSNVINTSQASGANISINGRTLVNLLGRDGNFENDTNGDGVADGWAKVGVGIFTLEPTSNYGTKSQRITSQSSDTTYRALSRSSDYNTVKSAPAGTNFLALVDLTVNGAPGELRVQHSGIQSNAQSSTSKTLYVKVKTTVTADLWVNLYNNAANGVVGWVQYDGLRLYEISAAEYAKIDVDPEYTGEKLAEKFPYVDSVKHLRNPAIRKKGKNLLPPLTQWIVHANSVVTEPYKLTLNATANYQYSTIFIPVLPLTTYTINLGNVAGQFNNIVERNAALATITFFQGNPATTNRTFTTSATTAFLDVQIASSSLGTFTFANPQLELGNVATQFEPQNDDYLYLPTVLASNIDGSVKDTYNDALGTVTRRWRTGVVLDGSLSWTYVDGSGLKRYVAPGASLSKNSSLTKYDGKILSYADAATLFNAPVVDTYGSVANDRYDLIISDNETGFDDAYTPTTQEIQAFFNGWQINNGNVGTKYLVGPRKWTPLVSPKADFEGKIAGSTVENPHSVVHGYSPTLLPPNSSSWSAEIQANLDKVKSLDGIVYNPSNGNTNIAQMKFSKNLIEHVIRKHGSWLFGSAVTVSERVAWLKANVSKLLANAYIFGSGPAGNKAYFALWQAGNGTPGWGTANTNTGSISTKTSIQTNGSHIDANGFIHFVAYADAAGLLLNPTVAPIVTATGSGSQLAAGTYYVSYRWVNAAGSTLCSSEVPITITAGQQINVTTPATPLDKGVTGTTVHIGTSANIGAQQGYTNNITGAYTQTVALVATIGRPSDNNLVVPSTINTDYFELDVELNVGVLPTAKSLSYTPYMLDYQLATSVEETIVAEGSIGLQAGGNQIVLLEGVVIREKANPILNSGVYYINANAFPASWFKNKAEMIMSVYKNGVVDSKAKYPNPSGGYGNVTAQIQILEADFDATAEYTVTYLPLDKYKMTTNIIDTTLTYQSTLGGTVAKNTQDITDIKTKDSVQDWRLMLDEAYAANTRYDLNTHRTAETLDHPDGSVTDAKIGNRTIDDMVAAAAGPDTPTRLWSKLANMVKAITGKDNWFTRPATTLEATSLHIAASTGIHGATSAATANALMQRDANGRTKTAAPSANDDVVNKAYADLKLALAGGSMTGDITFENGTSPHAAGIRFGDGTGWRYPFKRKDGTVVATLRDDGEMFLALGSQQVYHAGYMPFIVGTYMGDGTMGRDVELPFKASYVTVFARSAAPTIEQLAIHMASNSYTASSISGGSPLSVFNLSPKFSVSYVSTLGYPKTNESGKVYFYIAYR